MRSQPEQTCGRGERGFSLVEVMLAALFGVVIIGAMLSLVTAQSAERQANVETSLALSAAFNNLEQARTVAYADLPTLDGVGFDVPGSNGKPGGLHPIAGDPDGLPGQITVTVDQATAGIKLYRITAAVGWEGVTGRRRLLLETLIGDRK